jgi:hypothetical protein
MYGVLLLLLSDRVCWCERHKRIKRATRGIRTPTITVAVRKPGAMVVNIFGMGIFIRVTMAFVSCRALLVK